MCFVFLGPDGQDKHCRHAVGKGMRDGGTIVDTHTGKGKGKGKGKHLSRTLSPIDTDDGCM